MHAARWTMRRIEALVVLATLLVAGCGGSGSSGFDPSFLEGLAIQQALDEGRCVAYRELEVCPSGAAVPGAPGGFPGAPDVRIDVQVERADVADCAGGGDAGARCAFAVVVATDGLPPGAEVRLAARLLPDGAWQLGAPLAVPSADGSGAALLPATLEVRPTDGAVDAVQLAVLVFASPPGALPAEVDELASTGASWAFVVPALEPAPR